MSESTENLEDVNSWSAHPKSGIKEDFEIKVAVAERMAYISQLANASTNPEMLKWLRNRLSEPYGDIQRRLKAYESQIVSKSGKNHLQKNASVE